MTTSYRHGLLHSYLPNVPCTAIVVCLQDLRSRMGASIAWAARTGLKYSRRNAILPPATPAYGGRKSTLVQPGTRPTQDFKGDARDYACPDSPQITFLSDMPQQQTILSADCSLRPLKQTTCDRHIGSPPTRLCRRNRAKEHTRLARSC
jgi:hypothetical protein